MGRKQAEKAIQLQTETMIYGNERMIQKMKPKAQSQKPWKVIIRERY